MLDFTHCDYSVYDACCIEFRPSKKVAYFTEELQPWRECYAGFWQEFAEKTKVSLADYSQMHRSQRGEFLKFLLTTDFYKNLNDHDIHFLIKDMFDPAFLKHPNAGQISVNAMINLPPESYQLHFLAIINSSPFKMWKPSEYEPSHQKFLQSLKSEMGRLLSKEDYDRAIHQRPFVQ